MCIDVVVRLALIVRQLHVSHQRNGWDEVQGLQLFIEKIFIVPECVGLGTWSCLLEIGR